MHEKMLDSVSVDFKQRLCIMNYFFLLDLQS
jgi:hypothetical protein